jgi:hypothetical protein
MRKLINIIMVFCFFSAQYLYAETNKQLTEIAPKGETVIVAKSKSMVIDVTIMTQEVNTGEINHLKCNSILENWTYTSNPRCIVSNIKIIVGDKQLEIPTSMIWGLTDVHWADISINDEEATLTLLCGDASEAYDIKIIFDKNHIKYKTLSYGFDPDETVEKTTYYEPLSIE